MQIYSKMLFDNPLKIIEAFDNKSVIEAFSLLEKFRKTHYLIGYMRYELKDFFLDKKIKSKMPLIYFEVFESFKPFKATSPEDEFLLKANPQIDYRSYEKAIKKIKCEIANGNTYQVNYTYDFKVNFEDEAFELYSSILPKQTTSYNAFIRNKYETIMSFSPELFFELEKNTITTKPMKGTMPRGKDKTEDKENIEFLKHDIKNKAENVMIVDLLRNDLGKIAKAGSVKVDKLFEIETHKTLHQMTSEITAELEENTTLLDIFNAIFPCGSITGAPKISTMKIIDKIEHGKREVYCGAIGFLSPEKSVFSVPIRILQKKHDEKSYRYRVGGAIVWDSTAKDEWEETITKAKILGFEHDFSLLETILVQNLKPMFFDEHIARMRTSVKELGFKFNEDLAKLKPQKDGIMRILLSKEGSFEEQYLPLNESKTDLIKISPAPINSLHTLIRHKTTYRPWYQKSLEQIKTGKIYDEIFFNENGELTEGARSNIVLEIDDKLYTPPVKCGLLNGIYRQNMLKKRLCTEKILYIEDLETAKHIYCINSVRGIKEVRLT